MKDVEVLVAWKSWICARVQQKVDQLLITMISGKVNRSYSVILLIEYHTASLSHLSCLLLMNH